MLMDLTIAVPVILALVEGFKGIGLKSRYAFLVSVALGVLGFYFLGDGDTASRIFEGVVSGLSASGLYSGVKRTVSYE